MSNNWSTMECDIEAAKQIFLKHTDLNDGEEPAFLHILIGESSSIDIMLSPWVLEMAHHFGDEYGYGQGQNVTRRVLTKCLIGHSAVH